MSRMYAETLAGRVIAVLSRRALAFQGTPKRRTSDGWARIIQRRISSSQVRRGAPTADEGEETRQPPVSPTLGIVSPPHPESTQSAPPPYPTQGPGPASSGPPSSPPERPVRGGRFTALDYESARVHIATHQRRGAESNTLGHLLLHVPNFLCSLLIVMLLSSVFGDHRLIGATAWLASGALVLVRPLLAAGLLARGLLRMRYPTPTERDRLEPVWREVTARAGLEPGHYELWIQDSRELNAAVSPSPIIGVTNFSLELLPNSQLAAVLAYELGQHVRRRSWLSLLSYWYEFPSRIVCLAVGAAASRPQSIRRVMSYLGAGVVVLITCSAAFVTLGSTYGLPLLVLLIPFIVTATDRRAAMRGDQYAATLGFAPPLAEALEALQRQSPLRYRGLAEVLSPHPAHHTRLRRLVPYLAPSGRAETSGSHKREQSTYSPTRSEQVARQRHYDLLREALDDTETGAFVDSQADSLSPEARRQYLFANALYDNAVLAWRAGAMGRGELRGYFRSLLQNQVFRSYWVATAEHRANLLEGSQEAEVSRMVEQLLHGFDQSSDDEWWVVGEVRDGPEGTSVRNGPEGTSA